MKLIFGGHWKPSEEGWTILTEQDCDIRYKLPYEDSSVEAIFTEHVLEHINFVEAVGFLEECFRILKPGGSIRTVMPSLTTMTSGSDLLDKEASLNYFHSLDSGRYSDLQKYINNVRYTSLLIPVLIDNLTKYHQHKFIWSDPLYVDITQNIGFKTKVCKVGDSPGGIALERKCRGISGISRDTFDIESSCFESQK